MSPLPEPGNRPKDFVMAAGPQFNQPLENPAQSLIMDELEAGEAAVELDDKEPQEVLAWAMDRFGKELAICCSFQADGCALIDMRTRSIPTSACLRSIRAGCRRRPTT